jgi:hypothetical protein
MDNAGGFPKKAKTKRAEQPEGSCCVGVLDDDTLADIFSRLPTSASVMRVSATCRSWRRVIAARPRVLSRHTRALCGVFSSYHFNRAAAIESSHLDAEMPESGFDVSALPGGTSSSTASVLSPPAGGPPFAHSLAVYHLVTRNLATLPPLPRARCSFIGAGLFLDGISATAMPLFKVGCVTRDVVSDNKWLLNIHGRSGGWETLHASAAPGTSTDGIERLCLRARVPVLRTPDALRRRRRGGAHV